jgi:hypothetical protein
MKLFAWKNLKSLTADGRPGDLAVMSCCLRHARAAMRQKLDGKLSYACEAFFTEPDIIRDADLAIEGTQPTAWIVPEQPPRFKGAPAHEEFRPGPYLDFGVHVPSVLAGLWTA